MQPTPPSPVLVFDTDDGLRRASSSSIAQNFWEDALVLVDYAARADRKDPDVGAVLLYDRNSYVASRQGISNTKAFLLVLKSYVGTSILILPTAFNDSGWAASCAALVIAGVASIPCLVLLTTAAQHLGVNRYSHIAAAAFGKHARVIADLILALAQMSCCVMNFAFLFRTIERVLDHTSNCDAWVQDWKAILLFSITPVVILPVALVRRVQKLALPVFLSDIAIFVGIITMLVQSAHVLSNGVGQGVVAARWEDVLVSVGTDVFTFEGAVCTILPIRSSMSTPQDFPLVLSFAIAARMLVYITFATMQYLAYGVLTRSTAILNLPANTLTMALYFAYMLAIVMLFPQIFHPCSIVLEDLLGMPPGAGRRDQAIKYKKNVFRFLLLGVMELIAVLVLNDLDVFTSICGALFLVPLVFVFPPLFYIIIIRGDSLKSRDPVSLLCVAVALVAIALSIGIVVQAVMLSRGDIGSRKQDYCG